MMPALFTRMSTEPQASLARSTIAETCSRLPTSAWTANASPPPDVMASTTSEASASEVL